jgi:putative PEP-CTERM system histidine kinase
MAISIDGLSYGSAAVAFVVLAALLLVSWRRGAVGAWLMVAAVVSALWAVYGTYGAVTGSGDEIVLGVLELLRSAAWIGCLLWVLFRTPQANPTEFGRRYAAPAIAALFVAMIGLEIAAPGFGDEAPGGVGFDPSIFGRLAIAVVGVLLVENLFRNTRLDFRWNIKFLCIGLGGLFAYDFALYSDALLFQRINEGLISARGFTNAVVAPLVAIAAARNRGWAVDVFVSRKVVFHTATLVGTGLYLLAMAGVGYYLREFGGRLGPVVVSVFVFAAFVVLVLVVFSGGFRAWLRVNINKHFFSYKYDYREEWLRLIATLSSVGIAGGLPVRVIRGVADIVESPEGALWLREEDDRFSLCAQWNCSPEPGSYAADASFTDILEERRWIINLEEIEERPDFYAGLVVPDWIRTRTRPWLVVPLMHHETLLGFLLLGRPRAPTALNWEDYDLLKTFGRHAASYLAEQQSAQALAEARQFDEFNRRFAFVMHDIKNLVSQLSLIVANAGKFKDNPAFQDDVLQTVKESVDKMNRLLVRLHESGREAAGTSIVELSSFLHRVVDKNALNAGNIALDCRVDGVAVVAEEERLSAVMAHLIDNAVEATGDRGKVSVGLDSSGGDAIIEITDDGPGMDAEFIRTELFRPFRSTKPGGYGIGVYESRAFVRGLGGRLDVVSAPGHGTTVRIRLPAVNVSPAMSDTQPGIAVQ